ncbi:hypothetical protein V5O48_005146 [Marasmius crinis-equi]|uniref:Uncharacterized protein n=1 Tax=Marasmius crinis-equi TaxID=585013 RepID=A0ABR3FN52_9AGAR
MALTPSQSYNAELRARVRGHAGKIPISTSLDLAHHHLPARNPSRRRGLYSVKYSLLLVTIVAIVLLLRRLNYAMGHTDIQLFIQKALQSGPPTRVPLEKIKDAEPPKTTPKPFPVVDRSILDRLGGAVKGRTRSGAGFWPPVVIRVPEPIPVSASSKPPCHEAPCRFLVPLRLAEQESKARLHLAQVFLLARKLDRTVVLPRVGKSRLGACLRWEFEVYYDLERLVAEYQDVVTMDVFERWFRAEGGALPSVQAIYLQSKPDLAPDAVSYQGFTLSLNTSRTSLPKCLLILGATISSPPPIVIHPKQTKHEVIGDDIIARLYQDSTYGLKLEADILAVDWNLRFPLFPVSSFPAIEYAPKLSHLAEQLAPSSPYLMVHWRMETVAPEVFSDCALALVDSLWNTLNHPVLGAGINTIWFASDHPVPISSLNCSPSQFVTSDLSFPSKSSTFTGLRETHVEALGIVRDAFCPGGELEGRAITDLNGTLQRAGPILELNPEVLADSGISGILDKLVGMRAAVFISGSKTCSKKSSFTKQIVDMRKKEKSTRNVVEYFG